MTIALNPPNSIQSTFTYTYQVNKPKEGTMKTFITMLLFLLLADPVLAMRRQEHNAMILQSV